MSFGWDDPPLLRNVTFLNGTNSLSVSQNLYGNNRGLRVDHTFIAAAATHVVTLTPAAVEALSPDRRDRVGQIEALVEAQAWYWDEARSVYVIHDFLDYHPSKDEREADRKKERERKRKERAE